MGQPSGRECKNNPGIALTKLLCIGSTAVMGFISEVTMEMLWQDKLKHSPATGVLETQVVLKVAKDTANLGTEPGVCTPG